MKTVVLTITNDMKLAQLLQKLLASTAIEVVSLSSLQLAAQYLQTGTLPQLVILDWTFQVEASANFLRKMKSMERFADLPVLVVVAEPDPVAVREAFAAGANRYITAGFLPANLLRTVREMNQSTV